MLYHRFAHDSIDWCADEVAKIIIEEIDTAHEDYKPFISLALKAVQKRVDDLRIKDYPEQTGND